MTSIIRYAVCTGFAALLPGCASTHVISPDVLSGEYTTVSESSCNVTLSLLPSRTAKVTSTCRVEGGSGRDESRETLGTWVADEHQIVVRYGNHRDSLEYAAQLPFAPFGLRGAGPGLRVLRASGPNSALAGYEALWRTPVGRSK